MSAKKQMFRAIQAMPDDLSWDEIVEELEIIAAIRRADDDISAGNFVTQEDVEREIETWFPASSE
jgi:predicted transcriptional regulator